MSKGALRVDKAIWELYEKIPHLLCEQPYGKDARKVLEDLPSAQPEIIRCKDCKYRYLDGMIWNCPFGLSSGEDFFCAYGAIGGGSGT